MSDFFISYNKADKQSAEWVAWQLETAGFSVLIQAWDFRPGSNFVLEMNRAAQEARRTIAILSPDYLTALYTYPEWAAAFAQDPTGERGQLVCVLVREAELKGLLKQIIYINLVGLDEDSARNELLHGLNRRRAKPTRAPAFFVASSSLAAGQTIYDRSADEQPASPGHETPLLSSKAILPPGFRASFNNFLATYLGSLDHPVPFGGRAKDLQRLNEWLDHDDQPPYLCIATEAGRGKSALLAQWARQLICRQDLFIIFIPVSIRFETNTSSAVFGALASLLAEYRGDEYPIFGITPPEILKALSREYLSRGGVGDRKLVVILDGLDEAADWEAGPNLFPLSPPTGLRIIVSMRNKAGTSEPSIWLRTLGWERAGVGAVFPLHPLTESGVADVIKRSEIALQEGFTEAKLANQIFHVSEGDPLLISLYVSDFKRKNTRQESISQAYMEKVPPGLDAYFRGWLEEQRKLWGRDEDWRDRSLHLVLSALSCALGPLLGEDIISLAGPEAKLDSWIFSETLRPLGRLVVGDGRKQAITFVHPRLGNYFREERMTTQERAEWEQRFIRWGHSTLAAIRDNQLNSTDAPAYLIKFYSEHLQRIEGESHDLYQLLCKEWLRASVTREGSAALFLEDAWRVWKAAEREGPAGIGMQIRAALCFSSVASSTTKLNSDLLISCVRHNTISHALAVVIARQKPEFHEKVECLTALAELLPTEERQPLLAEALNVTQRIWEKDRRTRALVQVAARLPEGEQDEMYEQARQLMRQLSSASMYYVLKDTEHLWPASVIPSLVNDVVESARRDNNLWQRAWVLESISRRFESPKREAILRDSLDAATGQFAADDTQAITLAALAAQLPEPEKQVQLNHALALANKIDYVWSKIHAWREVASVLPKERLQEVVDAARELEDEIARSRILGDLASLLPTEQQVALYSEALQAAQGIESDWGKASALEDLALKLPDQFLPTITEAAWEIENQWARAEVLAKLTPRLQGEDQKRALEDAFASSQGIWDTGDRALTLARLLPMISDAQRLEEILREALELAHLTSDDEARASAIGGLIHWVKENERSELLAEAVDSASRVENDSNRAKALIKLLPLLSPQLLNKVFRFTQVSPDNGNHYCRWMILKALIAYLPAEFLQEVLEYIQTMDIEPVSYRTSLLTEIIPRLSRGQRSRALQATRRTLADADFAQILLAVAKSLPQKNEQMDLLKEAYKVTESLSLHLTDNKIIRSRVILQMALNSKGVERASKLSDALQLFRDISHQPYQLELFGEIYHHLSEQEATDVLEEILSAARTEEYIGNTARRLGRFGIQLQGEQRECVLKEALAAIEAIDDEQVYDRAMVLEEFVKHLPDDILGSVLEMTWQLGHDYHVPRILGTLASRWEAMCRYNKCAEFQQLSATLRVYRGCKREYMLELIRALLPVIERLGGERAISDTLSAIRETAKWWP
jgi:hypothetical protein